MCDARFITLHNEIILLSLVFFVAVLRPISSNNANEYAWKKNSCIEIRAASEKKLLRGTGNITFNLKSGSGTGTICSHSRYSSFLSTYFFFYSRAKQLCMAKALNCAGKYNNVDISKMFDSTLKIEWGIRVNCSEERPAHRERSRTQMKR